MNKKKSPESKELAIEINPVIEGGVYSNLTNIGHNKYEFIIDFAVVLPGKNAARVQSRIITSPAHAKQFLKSLSNSMAKYEEVFGEIEQEQTPIPSKPSKAIH